MRHERQVELLRRLQGAQASRPGPLGTHSLHNRASVYVSHERYEAEMRVLFGSMPQLAALSCEVASPGSYVTTTIGRVPIVVVRQPEGIVKAFVNSCRHRGATIFTSLSGDGLRKITCPYHAWTYGLDGCLRSFPGAESGFDDIDKSMHGLHELPAAEKHGLIFVSPDRDASVSVDAALHGAEDELADYDIGNYVHVETRSTEWNMNWKLVMDTFTEPYHIPWLHKDSIAPHYLFDQWIFDAYGPHPRFIGVRKGVDIEFTKENEDEWSLLPYGTIQYLLQPNAILTHQMDHLELWRLVPLAADRTVVVTSVFGPGPAPLSEKAHRYFVKNLDILLGVTNSEDFPAQCRIHQNLASGGMPEVVYGKMEPALVHYHTALNKLLADAGELVS